MSMEATQGESKESMHTGFPATVVSFNRQTSKAVIQPVYKNNEGSNYPQIPDVPVAKYRFPFLMPATTQPVATPAEGVNHAHTLINDTDTREHIMQVPLLLNPGDLVYCLCSEKSMDSVFSNTVHETQSKREFDLTDSVVICILNGVD